MPHHRAQLIYDEKYTVNLHVPVVFSNFYFDKHLGSGKPGSMTHSDDREVNLTNGRPLMPIKNVSMVKYFKSLSIHYKMIFQP